MEFESIARTPSYLESMESSTFMLDNSMDYLHYEPNSPSPSFNLASPNVDFNVLSSSLVEPFASNYTPSGNYTTSPPRSYSPAVESASISPPTLTYHLSGGELSSDDSGRRSRGENPTPPPVPYSATVPRSHRFNPMAMPATRSSARTAHKRRHSKSSNDRDSDAEEEEEYQPGSGVDPRREAIRRQRIESEQRRRDELRDGYARLKAVLPPSTAKSSKVSLLDRAAHHLKHLEACRIQAEARLKATEAELVRVRSLNEVLSLRAVQQREAAMAASGMNTTSFN